MAGTEQATATIVDFANLNAVPCPCGMARRGLAEATGGELSLHLVEISAEARAHYHRRQTEIYYILECGPEAGIELDGHIEPVRPGMAVHIPPGVRHRAVGAMRILNIVRPAFDPTDEFED